MEQTCPKCGKIIINDIELYLTRYPNENEIIILGDLNADCTYWDEDEVNSTMRSDMYTWLISNEEDTTVKTTDCTYDRILVTDGVKYNSSGVYDFVTELNIIPASLGSTISDHYPVWFVLFV